MNKVDEISDARFRSKCTVLGETQQKFIINDFLTSLWTVVNCISFTLSFLTRRREKNTGLNLSITYFLNKLCPKLGRSRGNYLTILYLIIKLLYVINAITQFVLLNKILGVDFLSYGVDALFLAVQGEDISLSNRYVVCLYLSHWSLFW